MAEVVLRNTITNDRMSLDTSNLAGQSVGDVVSESGFVAGDFSVRDKQGRVIDDDPIENFEGAVVNVGLPGASVVGGI